MMNLKTSLIASITMALCLSTSSALALPETASGENSLPTHSEKNKNKPSFIRNIKKPKKRYGLFRVSKHIVNLERCESEDLEIKVKIPHKYKAFWANKADAHLVAAFPSDPESGQAEYISWNLKDILKLDETDDEEKEHPVFQLSCDFLDSLEPGYYQLSIVLTVVGGSPLELEDWFHGLKGLIAQTRIKINLGSDELDLDDDGEIDGDSNLDGILDEEEEDEAAAEEESEEASEEEEEEEVEDEGDTTEDEEATTDEEEPTESEPVVE